MAIEALTARSERAEAALDEAATGGEALRQYLHAAIDSGLGAVNIVHPLLDDHDWPEQRDAARDVLDRLIEAAARDNAIDHEYTVTDIALATIRFCRPLAIGLDPRRRAGDRPPATRPLPRRSRRSHALARHARRSSEESPCAADWRSLISTT